RENRVSRANLARVLAHRRRWSAGQASGRNSRPDGRLGVHRSQPGSGPAQGDHRARRGELTHIRSPNHGDSVMRIPSDPGHPNRLRHILDDRLDEADQAELGMHLDDCASCRGTLDAMAARSVWWREARRFLGDEADHTRTNAESRKPEPDAATLDFLATSDN